MKIGFQTIVWGPRYRNLKYMLDVIEAAGYQGVQFFQPPEVLGSIDRILKLLEERKLKLIGLSGGSLAERMAFCSGFHPEYLYLDSWDSEACEKAMSEGFTLGLHPHAYMPIGRLEEAEKLLSEYPDDEYPKLKFVPDTAHLTVTHDDILNAIQANINRVVAVHLKDWSPEFGRSSHRYARGFTELGTGSIDLDVVLDLLKKIGYDGWVIVEQDYTVTDAVTNTLESAKWLKKRKLLSKRPSDVKSEAGLGIYANRQICSRKREVLFLRSIRRVPLQDINSWYETIVRAFQRLVPCKLIEVWTCSPAQDTMSLMAIKPDPHISVKTFVRRRHTVLSGDTMEHKAIRHFDLTDEETVRRFEHPKLVSKLGLKRMASIPIFNPWNFNHVRLIVNLFPDDERAMLNDDELFRFGEYVAFTLDLTLEDICSSSAAKANFQAGRCKRVKEYLDSVVNLIKSTIDCKNVAVFLVNELGNRLELKATTGTKWNVPKEEQFYRIEIQKDNRKGEGLTGWVWESRGTFLTPRANLERRCKKKSFEGAKSDEEDACLFVPLTKPTGEVIGVFRCRNTSTRRRLGKSEVLMFSEDDAAILEAIAQAAIPQLELLLDQEYRKAFFLGAAHTLSLPIQSIIADSANLVDDLEQTNPNYDTAYHLFNEVQGFQLVVANILCTEDLDKKQRELEFHNHSLFKILKRVCTMFMGEAADKGCDIRSFVVLGGKQVEVNPLDLDDMFVIYRKILYEPLMEELGISKGGIIWKNEIRPYLVVNGKERKVSPDLLPKKCFELNPESVTVTIIDKKVEVDPEMIKNIYLCKVEMVDSELALAFKNLLNNAVKYSYRTVPSSEKRYVKVVCELINPKYYRVSISNYGVGITKEEIDRNLIWKSGYRGKHSRDQNRTGAGLGLTNAKHVIEKGHGGKLEVISSLQHGNTGLTTLVATIPTSQEHRIS